MAVTAVMLLTSCYDYDKVVVSGDPVRVELSYTYSSATGSQTRQSDDVVVPNTSAPRLPQYLTVIQMIGDVPQNTDVTWEEPIQKPYDPAPENPVRKTSLYYYSSFCDMKQGVNGCLVYGGVDDASTSSDKANKGSLVLPSFSSISDLQTLSFSLESICSDTEAPEEASTLASYLNTVANASGWKTSDNIYLKNLFENFTGHGSDLPGSAASVKNWIEAVATVAQDYINNPPTSIGVDEKTILDNIVAAANGITITVNDNSYPRNKYLPDGAAAVRWTTWTDDQGSHEGFKPAIQTTTLDNINSVSRFAFPAPLFYFVDSNIRTSDEIVDYATVYDGVTSGDTKTSWNYIVTNHFTDGNQVNASTKSVALESPVEYAVAQLKLTVKAEPATGTTLKDNAGTDITVGETTFPLTGVIVCGQRPVNNRFEQSSNSDVDVKFIYDSQVKTNGSYYYLTSVPTGGPSTLVLQSYEGEDVDIILEFQNKGTQTFKCIEGFVYPGTRFYLIGKVAASSGTGGDTASQGRVFTKDYITTVNMKVSSLAKAYNVLPNLLTSNLEIGIETTPQWVAATPTVIRLE